MNSNRALLKSIRFLSRPVVPLLLVGLLANDFLLRRFWPSWLTGKLGDLAWLFIAPAVLAALLAWLIPAGWKRQEKLTGILSYGLVALAFILLKTFPPFHSAVLGLWQSSLGFPAAVVLDPTDLLALVMLALSAVMWFREMPLSPRFSLRAWMVLPLFALVTLADAAAPDYGIACLSLQDNQVIASAGYSSFDSRDGGLTWSEFARNDQNCFMPVGEDQIDLTLPGTQIRSIAGSRIEVSTDGGKTWKVENNLAGASQAGDAYFMKTTGGNPILKPGPLAAVYDPSSGDVIFAMGHQGVLVRLPDASYQWAFVGSYHPPDLATPESFFTVLSGEMVLSFALVLILLAAWAMTARRSHWLLKVYVVLAWLVWAVATFISPALSGGYGLQISWMAVGVTILLALPAGIFGLVALVRGGGWLALLIAMIGGVAFQLPYIFWYVNAIPRYTVAMTIALAFAVICAVGVILRGSRNHKALVPQ